MAEVGTAFVSILPSAKGFGKKLQSQVGGETKTAGKSLGAGLGKAFAIAGGATAIVGGLAKSISLAKDFDLTIRQVGVASGATGADLKSLSSLAMKMGADTAFSAKDAGDAMLELAKGGMTTAQIKGGALATTLKLAAAGGLELGAASTFVVQGMTTFGLAASDANRVAVALGGGANASTASVESLGQALSQVGPGAKTAGLSLEETVATLAAFDNAGIKGSDAGTSLKTMLTRLVPATDKASTAMDVFGLSFVDSKGNIDSISTVAQKLQKHLGGLSQAERTTALATIFGSDASRAASVLMDNGAKGIQKYIKATKDQSQVQKMANTAMGGASGAWDSFTGSIETLQIKLGTALLPAFTSVTKAAAGIANSIGTFVTQMQSGQGAAGVFASIMRGLGAVLGVVFGFISSNKTAVATFAGVILTVVAAVRIWAAVQLLLNAAMTANPIGIVVVAIALLAAGLVMAYKRSETFRNIVNGAFAAVKAAAKVLRVVVVSYFQILANVWLTVAGVIIKGAAKAFGWIPGIGPKIKGLARGFDDFKAKVNRSFNAIKSDHAVGEVNKLRTSLDGLKDKQVTVTTMFVNKGKPAGGGAAGLPGQARGTNDFAGGLTWVGERGPEIVNLPRHSQVIPNHKLGHAANGTGDGVMRVIVVNPGDIAMATDGRADMRVAAHAGVSREAARARR